MDRFYRFVWDQEDGYTVNVSHDHADAWMKELARGDAGATHKRNCHQRVDAAALVQQNRNSPSKTENDTDDPER
jgi:hypothetical protein